MHVVTRKGKVVGQSHRRTSILASLSEADLVTRVRGKEVGAFEELVDRTEDKLFRLAMRFVRNESDAQEILQESYLAAWRNLPAFEGRSQFSSWMYRIVVNASLMCLRARRRHPEVAIHDVDLAELNKAMGEATCPPRASDYRQDWPDQRMQSAELLRRIETAVNSLPEKLREVFLLRHVSGVSTGDVAARLGLSTPAAKTRLYRARTELRHSLGSYVAC